MEELIQDPQELVVLRRSEHFSHKCAVRAQKFSGQLECHEHEFSLTERVLVPLTTNVRSTVVQDTEQRINMTIVCIFSDYTYTSAGHSLTIFLISVRHLGVVMSS